jgi:hypothetical protein
MVIMMTPSASIVFVDGAFNDFLYAAICEERNALPLTVLSALARLNLDPWAEAAKLSELPTSTATQRLASLIARLPGDRAQTDMEAIADRLIGLLPCRGTSAASSTENAQSLREMTGSTVAIALLCVALGIALLMAAADRERSPSGNHADVPAINRGAPPQTQ